MCELLPNISVAVQIEPPHGYDGVPEPAWLETVVRRGLAQVLSPDVVGQVSLLLTDDETVRELNLEFRGVDRTTDVLSFSAEHGGRWAGDANDTPPAAVAVEAAWPADFPLPDDEPPPLGDIVISVPQAARQADRQGMPLVRELALLMVHGALHLLGHDHYADGERAAMQRLEQTALQEIFGDGEGRGTLAPPAQY